MKKSWICSLALFFFLSWHAFAIEGGHAKYVGGTAHGFAAGTVGRLDTTQDSELVFQYAGQKISIPYASINSSEYSKEVARHLGILPAIAVALAKARQYRHIFRISYRDANGTTQVVVLEVPKNMRRTLPAVLDAKAPHTTKLPRCGCIPSEN